MNALDERPGDLEAVVTAGTAARRLDVSQTTERSTFDDCSLRVGWTQQAEIAVRLTPVAQGLEEILGVTEATH